MIYKNICVYKRESKIKDFNMESYKLNPIVVFDWNYSSPIGKAENLRWEGNDLVCDLYLNFVVDTSMLFPMIGYLPEDKSVTLLVINLSVCRNVDSDIRCLSDQVSSNRLLINGRFMDYKMEELIEEIDHMPVEEVFSYLFALALDKEIMDEHHKLNEENQSNYLKILGK